MSCCMHGAKSRVHHAKLARRAGGSGQGMSKQEQRAKALADKRDLAIRKLVAAAVHRTNLLCLLAHGLLLDRAADDAMVQVGS